jgi:retron-type reverse transcriptase
MLCPWEAPGLARRQDVSPLLARNAMTTNGRNVKRSRRQAGVLRLSVTKLGWAHYIQARSRLMRSLRSVYADHDNHSRACPVNGVSLC